MKNKEVDELMQEYEEQTEEDSNEKMFAAHKKISDCEVSECLKCLCCLYCCG